MDSIVSERKRQLNRLCAFINALRDIQSLDSIRISVQSALSLLTESSCDVEAFDWQSHVLPALNNITRCTKAIQAYEDQLETLPKIPIGLLSIRDYSILQATIEIVLCWGVYPIINASLPEKGLQICALLPIEKRRQTNTCKLSQAVLTFNGTNSVSHSLSDISSAIVHLLLLPQFEAMLFPKYAIDIVAMLLYGKVNYANDRAQLEELLKRVRLHMPLRMQMSCLRAALGHCVVSKKKMILASAVEAMQRLESFRKSCGELLCRLVLEDEGVQMSMEMLLSAVDIGNTQARMQVAELISKCPEFLEAETYYLQIGRQLNELLLCAKTNKVIRETSVLILYRLAEIRAAAQPVEEIVQKMFHALFVYNEEMAMNVSAQEMEQCVSRLALCICGPTPSTAFLQALDRIFHATFRFYSFAFQSKSYLACPLEQVLIAWLRSAEGAARLLMSVLEHALPLSIGFRAGGDGGVAIGALEEPTKSLGEDILRILSRKELESSSLCGELFAALLHAFVHVRKALNEQLSAQKKEILLLIVSMVERLGASVLKSGLVILKSLQLILQAYEHSTSSLIDITDRDDSLACEEDEEMQTVCLGILMTILELGSFHRANEEESVLQGFIPILHSLSFSKKPDIANLAIDARVLILSRSSESLETQSQSGKNLDFASVLSKAKEDLSSTLVPLRARGLVSLTRLVKSYLVNSSSLKSDNSDMHALLELYVHHLDDSESYVFLAAVQGLATLTDAYPKTYIPRLVLLLQDLSLPIEKRIKISEALEFTARRCGKMLPHYAKEFVYAFLHCIRPQQKSEELEYALFRASCLSSLAEICVLLNFSLEPFVSDITTCILGILQMESEKDSKLYSESEKISHSAVSRSPQITVRRGAVFLIGYVMERMGYRVLELMPKELKSMYRALCVVQRSDRDSVVLHHTKKALNALETVLKQELFPAERDALPGFLSFLQIVK